MEQNRNLYFTLVLSAFLMAATTGIALAETPLGTAFSYTGQLKEDGLPLNVAVDIDFSLHADAVAPDQIGATFRLSNVEVVNGHFAVKVDFGAVAFSGSQRWMEVRVRNPHDPSDTAAFITLDPRHEITLTPYAQHALTAGVAETTQRPFREEGNNAVFEGGNVGIGTTTPGAKLDVAGDANFAGNVFADTLGTVEFAHVNNTGMRIDPSTNSVHLESDNQDVLTATNLGNVGIGTTSPQTTLHVVGEGVRVDGPSGVSILNPNNGEAAMTLNWLDDVPRLRLGGSGVGNRSGFHIQGIGDKSLLRILDSGKVGIGSADPGGVISNAKLDVAGGHVVVDNNFGFLSHGATGDAIGAGIDTTETDDLTLFAGGTARGTVTAGGNVGIGTADPISKLHIRDGTLGLGSDAVPNARLIVESSDSTLALFSGPGGLTGSAIQLGEFSEGATVNDWTISRLTTPAGADLLFNFSALGEVLRLNTDGDVDFKGDLVVDGEIRRSQLSQRRLLLTGTDFVADPSILRGRGSVRIGVTATPLSTTAYATIDLPDGAIIKAVSALVRDDDSEISDEIEVSLISQGFAIKTDRIAGARSGEAPGLTLVEFVTNTIIDREDFDYFIEAKFTNNFLLDQGTKALYAVDVLYETDAVEP